MNTSPQPPRLHMTHEAMADSTGHDVVLWWSRRSSPRNRVHQFGASDAPNPLRSNDGTPSISTSERKSSDSGRNSTGVSSRREAGTRRAEAVVNYFVNRPALLPFLLIVGFVEMILSLG